MAQIKVPTGSGDDHHDFHHLLPRLRLGLVSGEVFSKLHLASIPLDFDVREKREEVHNAAEKLQQGRSQGLKPHDKTIRGQEGSQHLLRQSSGARRREQDLQQGQQAEKAEALKKTKARKRK